MPKSFLKFSESIKSFINKDIETWNFKADPFIIQKMEHLTPELGNKFLDTIKNKFSKFYEENKDFLIELCNTNDKIGTPKKYNFNNFTLCSPSNLRYILHALLILNHIKDCNLNDFDIIEIGGGYGGLCFFVIQLSKLFKIKINKYVIFDLLQPCLLQKKYLNHLNIKNVDTFQINNFSNLNKNSFFISTYAFSEIQMGIQKKYSELILNKYISHGFLVWNYSEPYNFIKNKIITKELEFPLTFQKKPYNYYIKF